jgi:hypothetical protein
MMDETRYDRIAPTLATSQSRRDSLRFLASAAVGLVGMAVAREVAAAAAPLGPLDQRVTRTITLNGTCNPPGRSNDVPAHVCAVLTIVNFEGVFESVELIAGAHPDSDIRYHLVAQPYAGVTVPQSTYDTDFLQTGQSTGIITPQDFSPSISSIIFLYMYAEGNRADLPEGWLSGWQATLKITSIVRQSDTVAQVLQPDVSHVTKRTKRVQYRPKKRRRHARRKRH